MSIASLASCTAVAMSWSTPRRMLPMRYGSLGSDRVCRRRVSSLAHYPLSLRRSGRRRSRCQAALGPNIPIEYVEVGGNKLRYIKTGKGPTLVLLHTLRTQLDLFEKLVPELAKHFTVYALDYPGHGYSDIPKARYDAAFFADAVEGFLAKLDLLTSRSPESRSADRSP